MYVIENKSIADQYKVNRQDFTRRSPLDFSTVVRSILSLFKESVEHSMTCLMPQFSKGLVTGSAFTQARYKVKSEFFKELNQYVIKHYQGVRKKTWKGHRLIGVDGSTLNLPPSKEIKEHFGVYAITDYGISRSLARVSFLYDLLNDFVVEDHLTPMNIGEKTHFFERLDHIEDQNDIYILDRGYGHYSTVLSLINKDKAFCIRFSGTSTFIQTALACKEKDMILTWEPSPKEKENAKKAGLTAKPIKVRVSKIILNTGEIEVLVSNLINTKRYTYSDLKWLYHKRWVVEEGFKKMKPKMKIEYFGCRKSDGIYQEFYAHVIMMNLIAFFNLICNSKVTKKTVGRKYKYKTNWQNAFRTTRKNIINILSVNFNQQMLDEILEYISYSIIPVIPDKQSIRDLRNSNRLGRVSHYYK